MLWFMVCVSVPVQMGDEELQGFVVGRRKLAKEVSDFEEDSFKLNTGAKLLSWWFLFSRVSLVHVLSLFCQPDDIVIIPIQNQWLWQLKDNLIIF